MYSVDYPDGVLAAAAAAAVAVPAVPARFATPVVGCLAASSLADSQTPTCGDYVRNQPSVMSLFCFVARARALLDAAVSSAALYTFYTIKQSSSKHRANTEQTSSKHQANIKQI